MSPKFTEEREEFTYFSAYIVYSFEMSEVIRRGCSCDGTGGVLKYLVPEKESHTCQLYSLNIHSVLYVNCALMKLSFKKGVAFEN